MNSSVQDAHPFTGFMFRSDSQSFFGWLDYTFFCGLLGASLLIGIYFGFFSRQDSTAEYLMGGKRMGSFPIAMSIIASHLSGITLLGVPSEVYRYGSQYAACVFTSILTCLITVHIFLPVFYKLQLTSTFEYLEIRFARHVRVLSSFLFVASLFLYIPIVVYVPALAFSQVTGFSIHAITPILCTVCIFYTTIGGLKAVVWTDTVQFIVTLGGLFTVLALGIHSVGGVREVWHVADEGQRLVFFNMDPSPFARNTFWGMTIGVTMTWLNHLGINQGTVQRFLSVPREKDARRAMLVTTVGVIVVKLICVFTGLIMFTKYHDCDPLLSKAIERSDQTLPYYVMDVAGRIPGLPGLFLAGIVSAALATMSANLNTMSGIVYEDFLAPCVSESRSSDAREMRATLAMKLIVVTAGLIMLALVFVVERLGTVFQMVMTLRGITDGPALGLFVLGILFPWTNANGALFGGYVGLLSMLCLVVGAEWYTTRGVLYDAGLPTSIDGCPYPLNQTHGSPLSISSSPLPLQDQFPSLFRISFVYYTAIGSFITVLMGVLGSYLFGKVDLRKVDPDHITPFMRRFLPRYEYGEVSLHETSEKSIDPEKNGAPDTTRRYETKRPLSS